MSTGIHFRLAPHQQDPVNAIVRETGRSVQDVIRECIDVSLNQKARDARLARIEDEVVNLLNEVRRQAGRNAALTVRATKVSHMVLYLLSESMATQLGDQVAHALVTKAEVWAAEQVRQRDLVYDETETESEAPEGTGPQDQVGDPAPSGGEDAAA